MVKVEIGDVVVVPGGQRGNRTRRYVVINVARVWITVRPEEITDPRDRGFADKRFRLDDQTDGNRDLPVRFHTLAQWEAIELESRACAFLREQGIDVRNSSPWNRRWVELADLIRKAVEP